MRPARARRSSSDGPVDLRSDTVTRPTKRMREAMAAAEVDDDVLGHDPTMRELETRVAGLLGTDDALWTPSGSMGNLIALMSHLRRGDAFLAPAGAHVLDAELGTAAWLAGGMPRPLPHDAGPGKGLPRSRPPGGGQRRARTTRCAPPCCAWRTPTTRRAAPSPPPTSTPPSPPPRARRGLRVHLDGARLWHAAVALGVPPATLTVGVDTVQVCFSKGLGAPVGSAVAGSTEFVQEARRLRKMLGGGVRQGGVLAAAALVGLDRMERLADDHAKARMLAAGLRERGWSVGDAGDQHRADPGRRPGRHAAPVRRRGRAGQQHGRQGPADAARGRHRGRHRGGAGPDRAGGPYADGRADGADRSGPRLVVAPRPGRAPVRRGGR